jgi:hypothetical protein
MSDHKLIPHNSPIIPSKLSLENTIQFRCHPQISCFNRCCQQIDITLLPYDIIRLKKRFNLTSSEFLSQYTIPFEMDAKGMPGVKIRTADDNPACPFLTVDGCGVYSDRPTACRYYAVGLLSLHPQGTSTDEDAYFLVKEDHCLGHQEDRRLTIREYRQEQQLEEYDEINREWRQLILKRRSAGMEIGQPSLRSYQLFFLASYNVDSFRAFVKSSGFLETYDIKPDLLQQFEADDEALLRFGFRFLKQVLFGEMTIAVKPDAFAKRDQRRKQVSEP